MIQTNISYLMNKIRELEKTEENKRRTALWKPNLNSAEAYWHGCPRGNTPFIPFTIEPEHAMWAQWLGFDLDRYYSDGKTYLLADLNVKIARFENFSDGTPIGKTTAIWMGAGFEASLFGVYQKYTKDKDPWIGREPILRYDKNIDKLGHADFYQSKLMENVQAMYQDMKALLDDDFTVVMPEWCRGPFGLACHLRGMDTICMDMVEDPQFVHELMRFTTDERKKWAKQRADFMKVPIQPGSLYNDEVNVPLMSPAFYEEFVLPYETELGEFYGGISYWHSCGNITPLEYLIQRIPKLEMIHISPWSDLVQSVKNLRDTGIALEVVLHPLEHVQSVSLEEIAVFLSFIRETTKDVSATVRADGMQVITGVEEDVKKIKEWARIANEVLGKP
ncbi:MAG: hypothetical protein NTX88_02435 [Candidatus Atribacteria bacterium]|nr:hypothetical protein [Candidatus Atribacteria bacterium]